MQSYREAHIKSEQNRSPRIVSVTPAKYREQADQAARGEQFWSDA